MKKIISVVLFLLLVSAMPVFAGMVETIDKDELKAMLDSPELILLDVRRGQDWSSSEYKIKGAVRLEEEEIDSALQSYPKDKTLVLYCA